MMNIEICKEDWSVYANAVEDRNPIHRSILESERLGLKSIVAPGMFIASHIQGLLNITQIERIRFSKAVYDEDILTLTVSGIVGNEDYTFKRDEEVVCSVKGVSFEKFSKNSPKELGDKIFDYITEVTPSNINYFMGSLYLPAVDHVPGMFLASLSASALLALAKQRNLMGMHISQSFTSYLPCDFGNLEIKIGDEIAREGRPHSYELRWVQKDRVIASGKSLVLPLGD